MQPEMFSMGREQAWMFKKKREERVLEPELISSEEVNMIGAPLQDVGVPGSPESEQVNKLENYKLLIWDELSRKQRDSGNRPTGRRLLNLQMYVGVTTIERPVCTPRSTDQVAY
jgi:hypothetical protein